MEIKASLRKKKKKPDFLAATAGTQASKSFQSFTRPSSMSLSSSNKTSTTSRRATNASQSPMEGFKKPNMSKSKSTFNVPLDEFSDLQKIIGSADLLLDNL